MLGRTVGHYRITDRLGGGGMGVVYKAEDTKLGRTVALKFLPPELTRDVEAKQRFEREARAASQLDHPNICTIHEFGEAEDGQMFLAMPCYDGQSLAERIEHGAVPLDEALRIVEQIARGLGKAHSSGIVHRDIKPANVMVTKDGIVKILDFGLAKLTIASASITKAHTTLGTAGYMAPEQIRGEEVGAQADIWALGVVLHELLTAKHPFCGGYAEALIYSVLNEEPASVPDQQEADRIIHRMLEKDPKERYQNVDEVLAELGSMDGKSPPFRRTSSPRRLITAVSMAAIVAAVIGVAIFTRPKTPRAPPAIRSIAVLPFENASRTVDTEYIGDGITDDITYSLARQADLRVLARSTVLRYKGKQVDPRSTGKQLGVEALVIGEVRQLRDGLAVNVEMVRTADGVQLWGQQYKRRATDLLTITDEITNDVIQHLQIRLAGPNVGRPSHTRNPAAYEAYLKGRYFWNQRPAGLNRSLEFFEEARTIDPGYALAHAGVALAYDTMGSWETGALDPNVAFPRAKAAALQAIALDPDNSAAHAALGFQQFNYERDFETAEKNLRKASELNPADSTPHHWLSHLYIAIGRPADSLRESLKALELDPLDPVIMAHLGWHYMHARDPDHTLAQADKTLAVYPTSFFSFWNRGIAYEEKGMLPQAIDAFRQAHALVPTATFATAGLAHALALSNRPSEARALLNDLKATRTYVSPFDYAVVYLALGDTDQALTQIERTVSEHNSWAIYLEAEPRLDKLRGDPRFIAISRKARQR